MRKPESTKKRSTPIHPLPLTPTIRASRGEGIESAKW